MQKRGTAIESIESTISELGQIFSHLAHMVEEQRETVQRIDDNILDVAENVSGAQRELIKYYNSVASNRWLILKVFGVSMCPDRSRVGQRHYRLSCRRLRFDSSRLNSRSFFSSQVLIVFFLLFILAF